MIGLAVNVVILVPSGLGVKGGFVPPPVGVVGCESHGCMFCPTGVNLLPSRVRKAESAPFGWLPLSMAQKTAPALPASLAVIMEEMTWAPYGSRFQPSIASPN